MSMYASDLANWFPSVAPEAPSTVYVASGNRAAECEISSFHKETRAIVCLPMANPCLLVVEAYLDASDACGCTCFCNTWRGTQHGSHRPEHIH